jgi:hypothetical protein
MGRKLTALGTGVVRRKFLYPEGEVELIDNRAAEDVVRLAAAGINRIFRKRVVIDVKPVAVIDVATKPRALRQPRARSRR